MSTPVIDDATAKAINLEISLNEARKLIRSIFEEATQHISHNPFPHSPKSAKIDLHDRDVSICYFIIISA